MDLLILDISCKQNHTVCGLLWLAFNYHEDFFFIKFLRSTHIWAYTVLYSFMWLNNILLLGWDGWIASPTQLKWVLASSGRCEVQGSLVCCSPQGCNESDMTKWLNNNTLFYGYAKLYPFICWRIFGLFPLSGYYE